MTDSGTEGAGQPSELPHTQPLPGEDPVRLAFDEARLHDAWASLENDLPIAGRKPPERTIYGGTVQQRADALEREFLRDLSRGLPSGDDPGDLGREFEVKFILTPESLPTAADIAQAAEESPARGLLAGIVAKRAGASALSSARAAINRILGRPSRDE